MKQWLRADRAVSGEWRRSELSLTFSPVTDPVCYLIRVSEVKVWHSGNPSALGEQVLLVMGSPLKDPVARRNFCKCQAVQTREGQETKSTAELKQGPDLLTF